MTALPEVICSKIMLLCTTWIEARLGETYTTEYELIFVKFTTNTHRRRVSYFQIVVHLWMF